MCFLSYLFKKETQQNKLAKSFYCRLAPVVTPVSEGERERWRAISKPVSSFMAASRYPPWRSMFLQAAALDQKGRGLFQPYRKNKTKHPHTGEIVSHCVGGGAPRAVICKGHFSGLPSRHSGVDSTQNLKLNNGKRTSKRQFSTL